MEFCENGDLKKLIDKHIDQKEAIKEKTIWKILAQMCTALKACHEFETDGKNLKILHRDIKPGNIFLDKNFNVKLGDFGLSKTLNPDFIYASTNVGTPYYMAPEQVSSSKYDDKIDIWSLGIVIYQMCTLSVPFKGTNYLDLAQRIATENIKPLPKIYSDRLKNVVKALLNKDPKKRPTASEL